MIASRASKAIRQNQDQTSTIRIPWHLDGLYCQVLEKASTSVKLRVLRAMACHVCNAKTHCLHMQQYSGKREQMDKSVDENDDEERKANYSGKGARLLPSSSYYYSKGCSSY